MAGIAGIAPRRDYTFHFLSGWKQVRSIDKSRVAGHVPDGFVQIQSLADEDIFTDVTVSFG